MGSVVLWKNTGLSGKKTRVSDQILTSCLTLSKLLYLSVTQRKIAT